MSEPTVQPGSKRLLKWMVIMSQKESLFTFYSLYIDISSAVIQKKQEVQGIGAFERPSRVATTKQSIHNNIAYYHSIGAHIVSTSATSMSRKNSPCFRP